MADGRVGVISDTYRSAFAYMPIEQLINLVHEHCIYNLNLQTHRLMDFSTHDLHNPNCQSSVTHSPAPQIKPHGPNIHVISINNSCCRLISSASSALCLCCCSASSAARIFSLSNNFRSVTSVIAPIYYPKNQQNVVMS